MKLMITNKTDEDMLDGREDAEERGGGEVIGMNKIKKIKILNRV
jgi:hypothetical protein